MMQGDELQKLTGAGLNLIQQALSIFDRDLRLAVCNRQYQLMFDLPDALTLPGTSFAETIRYLVQRGEYGPAADVEAEVQARVDQARAFQPHYMERTRANGRTISVEGSPLSQGGWVTVYTDITSIKRQEELLRARSEDLSAQLLAHAEQLAQANRQLAAMNAALEEAKRELTEIEARTRLVTEMTPAHIAHVDRDRRYTFSNRRLSSVMPGSLSGIVGRHMTEVLGPDPAERIMPGIDRALAGEAHVFEITHAPSGRRIRIALTPDTGSDGTVNGVYILSTDVTAETQARAALSQTGKRELAAQLTSGLAHDFANLLTIILGLQGRLARMPALPPGAEELVGATLAAARRGGTLLDRIASISGPRELRPQPTRLGPFLRDLATMAGPALPEAVSLSVSDGGLSGSFLLDAGSLQDALLNLILNAKDAIGPRPGHIELAARAVRDTWLDLVVEDSGPGFSAAALDHGLDPFFTTKGGEGSGLGLSMVYDHAKLSGGSVRLENRGTGGARVVLRLPLRRASKAPDPLLVLLVEDRDEIRTDVREMLRGLGHNVIEAASAAEALELAALPGLGLVLSDIGLPGGMTGVDLATTLQAQAHPARLLLMTSLPAGDTLRRAAPCPVLGKPFTPADLAAFLTAEAA